MQDLSTDTVTSTVAMPERTTARMIGNLALLRQQSVSPVAIGRCKGRGTRIVGRHIVSGKTHVLTDASAGEEQQLPRIDEGDIVVAASFRAEWADALLAAGGLVIEDIGPNSCAKTFASRHHIPLILNIPNAGQFVHGEPIYLLGDGRVVVSQ